MNSKWKCLLLSTVFILTSMIANCQQLHKMRGGKYLMENRMYKYGELSHIFAKNTIANALYLESRSKHKKFKVFGIIALTSVSSGLLLIELHDFKDMCNGVLCLTAGDIFGGLLVIGGSFCAISSMGLLLVSSIIKEKSVRIYNESLGVINKKYRSYLSLGVNKNGLSLTMNF